MVRARRQAAAAVSSTSTGHVISALEHPVVWDLVGKGRYLQVAVSKAIAQLYVWRFGTTTSRQLSVTAAREGCLDLLLWTRGIGCVWDQSLFLSACEGNRVNILEHLVVDESLHPDGSEACRAAAKRGNTTLLKFLHEHYFHWDSGVTCDAAAFGHLDTLKWLHESGCPLGGEICALACSSHRLDIIKWLVAQGCALTLTTMQVAANMCNIEILEYLVANNAHWDGFTCAMASAAGKLDSLQFLRARGCPWDDCTIKYALFKGHHEVAQWARENGCPEPINFEDTESDSDGGDEEEE